MRFTHFIFTRFDYPDDYPHLDERLRLFRKYTVPSIVAQTRQDFTWIIRSTHPEVAQAVSHVPQAVLQTHFGISPKTDWCITSRVDNDDALAPQYVATIQDLFDKRECLIDSRGLRFHDVTGECVVFDYYGEKRPSPFISLIEPTAGRRTVLHAKHGRMADHHDVVRLYAQLWVQVIHPTNKLMQWSANRPAAPRPLWLYNQLLASE